MINIFKANDIVSPYAQHKTFKFKLYNENMKNAIRVNTISLLTFIPIGHFVLQIICLSIV